MKWSVRVKQNLFLNLPTSVVFCWFIQKLAFWSGMGNGFNWKSYLINLPIGYSVGFLSGLLIPGAEWGMKFAAKCKAGEGSWRHAILTNVIANTVNSTVMLVVMTCINVHIFEGAPMSVVGTQILKFYVPVWIVGYVVSIISVSVWRTIVLRENEKRRGNKNEFI